MDIYIKNMVCDRCILVVRQQLDKLGLSYKNTQLGEVELTGNPSAEKMQELRSNLKELGFDLLDDKKSTTVEKIKNIIIQLIHNVDEVELNQKLSVILEEKMKMDYHYLTGLFSAVEGTTIEKYVILQRIEKAKELLSYDELSLGEIAARLGYSSVQHLSQQFRKVTGLTTSQFKQAKENQRKPLDKV
ncbi:helix-turn-helix domain-containing protein [Chitinophaga japonensis]|uniref:AraC-like DNA-binding protein n=1 Tax=Chitinophaga japonensis TaxID=104662 RepID=A0A562SMX5_CHIJA|nr:AraC family transcriptional regulator [Chitinophaga japonensis]TWI82592.1 AraC-like DNA-binding protein [Chitinophaga japonensis]